MKNHATKFSTRKIIAEYLRHTVKFQIWIYENYKTILNAHISKIEILPPTIHKYNKHMNINTHKKATNIYIIWSSFKFRIVKIFNAFQILAF